MSSDTTGRFTEIARFQLPIENHTIATDVSIIAIDVIRTVDTIITNVFESP